MKLYVSPFAPNPMRVQIFMAEKGIAAETIEVTPDTKADYRAVNPLGQVPALVLGDGTVITESLTICHYLDTLADPPLFGANPAERALIGMWERRAEMGLFNPSIEYGHHVHPMFAPYLKQFPDWAKAQVPRSARMIEVMADRLDAVAYLAGDTFSAADLTAYLGYFGLVAYGALPRSERPSIGNWAARMLARESMTPLRQAAAAFGMEVA